MRAAREWSVTLGIAITLLASQPGTATDELHQNTLITQPEISSKQSVSPANTDNHQQHTSPADSEHNENQQQQSVPSPQEPGNSEETQGPAEDGADQTTAEERPPVTYQSAGFTATPLPAPPDLSRSVVQAGDIEPREVLVVTASMVAAKEAAQALERFGMRLIRRRSLNNLGFVLSAFRVPEDRAVSDVLAELRRALPEAWVDVNHHYRWQADARSSRPRTYARALMNWPVEPPACSHDRRLGLIDTGVAPQHPALSEARIESRSFLPAGIEPSARDHGTAIAALLVGGADTEYTGLIPNARLYAASVYHEMDDEGVTTTSERIVLALDWLIGNEVEVINLSLAGNHSLILELAVRRVHESGVRMIAAAGNDSRDKAPVYPAEYSQVIAVTAVDSETVIYDKASHGDYIEFAAPGVDVWTASARGGRYVSGTSFAVPFVSAAVLLAEPSRLQELARDLGDPGRDPVYGHGLVQYPGCP